MSADYKCYLASHRYNTVYGLLDENEKGAFLIPLFITDDKKYIGNYGPVTASKAEMENWEIEVLAEDEVYDTIKKFREIQWAEELE